MKLSVIIPTYNREDMLCGTIDSVLNSIQKSNCSRSFELIIVDQTKHHKKSTQEYLERQKKNPFFIYIFEDFANLPNARNVGIKKSKGEILVFLDDDVILHDGFWDKIIEAYMDNSIVSVVGIPYLKNLSGENIVLKNHSIIKKQIRSVLNNLICFRKSSVITIFGLTFANREKSKAGLTDTGKGCCMSFRRDLFNIIGMFDINYVGNALREETDLFCRIKKKKLKCYFDPAIALDHLMENSGGCRSEHSLVYWQSYFDNQFYYYKKIFDFSKWYISLLLIFDILAIKKQGLDYLNIIKRSYNRAVTLLS